MHKFFYVDSKTKTLLNIGNKAITYAKTKIPYAGNIERDIRRTNFDSAKRAELTRLRCGFEGINVNHSRKIAHTAIITKGGLCGEYASLTYIYLRDYSPSNIYIAICSNTKEKHSFTAILTQKRNFLTKNDIIVDAWPPYAEALLARHYKWNHNIKILRIKSPKQSLFIPRQIVKKYNFQKLSEYELNYLNKKISNERINKYINTHKSNNLLYTITSLMRNPFGYCYKVKHPG